MAGRGAAETADKYRTQRFEIHGTAAYDIRKAAVRNPRPVVLPEEREQPAVHVRHVRARMYVSPFAVLGIAVTVFLAVLVIFGYVRLYEASAAVTGLERQLSSLEQERSRLESKYDSKVNLAEIEEQAAAMGMSKPKTSQVVYLNLGGSDRAEVTPAEHIGILTAAYRAIRDSIREFVEYLS